MTVTVGKSLAFGKISAPPSKSVAHRCLISAAFSEKSVISNLQFSDDIIATTQCLKELGAQVSVSEGTVKIGGIDFKKEEIGILNCNESGSTLRFLIPICLLFNKEITIKGSRKLFTRNLSVYEEICRNQGIKFELSEDSLTLCGKLKSDKYTVNGDISSQFITGLIFALSHLEEDSIIEITNPFESASYVDLTINVLNQFGVNVKFIDKNTIFVGGKSTYKSLDISVEGDYSNAAFLDAFNLIGGKVEISGLSDTSLQGDKIYKEYFKLLKNGSPTLDVSNCPDLAPVLIVLAAILNGAVLTGTRRLKIKESDRGLAMKEELDKFGCKVDVFENKIIVNKCDLISPKIAVNSHNDHRIVMATTLLLTLFGGEIKGAEAVNKSYPEFFDVIKKLGVNLKVNNNETH